MHVCARARVCLFFGGYVHPLVGSAVYHVTPKNGQHSNTPCGGKTKEQNIGEDLKKKVKARGGESLKGEES